MNGLRQLALVTTFAMAGMTVAMTAHSYHLGLPALGWPMAAAKASTPAVRVRTAALSSQPALIQPKVAIEPQTESAPVKVALASQPVLQPKPAATPQKPAAPAAAPMPPQMAPAAPPPPLPPSTLTITPDESSAVADRVRDLVPRDLFPYFDVYLYVSKAAEGAWAQHMYVFDKAENGDFVFEEAFPVSTGRELHEKYFTSTPTGMFELDPDRFDRVHFSRRWNGAAMPWAMFLDYTIRGHATGVAMHSAAGHAFELGHRASGGCIRLPPEKAEELFKRFQAEERGLVPEFAFDDERQTTLTDGSVVRDSDGNISLQDGYKVLLIVEDYPGGPAIIAMLS